VRRWPEQHFLLADGAARRYQLRSDFAVSGVSIDPDPVLARYDVSYVVWSPNTALAMFLTHDPKWRVVDHAGPAVVFGRRGVQGRGGI